MKSLRFIAILFSSYKVNTLSALLFKWSSLPNIPASLRELQVMVQSMKLTFSTYQGNGKLAGMPFQRGSLRLRARIHKMAEQHPAGLVNFEEIFGMPLDSPEKTACRPFKCLDQAIR